MKCLKCGCCYTPEGPQICLECASAAGLVDSLAEKQDIYPEARAELMAHIAALNERAEKWRSLAVEAADCLSTFTELQGLCFDDCTHEAQLQFKSVVTKIEIKAKEQ